MPDRISHDADLVVCWRRRAPWRSKPHKPQRADILHRLAGVLYVVSQLVRCLRLCTEPHYSHDPNRPATVVGRRVEFQMARAAPECAQLTIRRTQRCYRLTQSYTKLAVLAERSLVWS